MSKVAFGLVLAGGLGRRMGGMPKHHCRLGGRTLLEHAIARVRPQVERLLVSCNDPALHIDFGIESILPDPVPGFRGPLAGVLAGLEYARAHTGHAVLLSVAVDTPWFPLDLGQRLCAAQASTGAELAVAASGGFQHPVFALWPVAAAAALRQLLESPARAAVRDFQALLRTVVVEWECGALDPFLNINTPEELETAGRILHPR